MKIQFCLPSRLLFSVAVWLLAAQLLGAWLFGLYSWAQSSDTKVPDAEIQAQLKCIRSRLAFGEANLQQEFLSEGKIFVWAFYGYALINMATHPGVSQELLEQTRQELLRCIKEVSAVYKDVTPAGMTEVDPPGGIILAGNLNLLRAGYALLAGRDPAVIGEFHKQSQSLFDYYAKTKNACLQSAQDAYWPCDNMAAQYSLMLHDRLFGTRYNGVYDRFITIVSTRVDERTGAMMAQVNKDGASADAPRGNALAWSLFFLPSMAPELARQQYLIYRKNWYMPVMGMTGVRERLPGGIEKKDIYDGLVVAGLGVDASGLGIAACRANGDFVNWRRMMRGLQAIGLPVWGLNGEKAYLGRRMLMADVFALWGETVHNWLGSDPPPIAKDGQQPDTYWLVLTLASLLSLVIMIVASLFVRHHFLLFRQTEQRWTKPVVVLLVIQLACIGIMVWYGEFTIIALLAIVPWLEDAFERPYYVRRAFEEQD